MRRMSALQRRYFGKRAGRRSSRSSFRSFKRARHSSGGSLGGDVGIALSAAAYGAGREWLSEKAQPLTRPLAGIVGDYSDEVLFLALGWALRHGKIPGLNKYGVLKELGTAVMVVESARIGSGVAGGLMNKGASPVMASPIYG